MKKLNLAGLALLLLPLIINEMSFIETFLRIRFDRSFL
jgi:hypothetical protein